MSVTEIQNPIASHLRNRRRKSLVSLVTLVTLMTLAVLLFREKAVLIRHLCHFPDLRFGVSEDFKDANYAQLQHERPARMSDLYWRVDRFSSSR